MKPLTKLKNLEAFEVSLVKKGANKKKRYPIYKQKGVTMDEKIIKAVLETPADGEDALNEIIEKVKMDDESAPVIKGLLRLLVGFKDKLPTETVSTLAKMAGYAEIEPKKEKEEKKVENGVDLSTLPEEVRKQFEAVFKTQETQLRELQVKNEATTKQLEVEKEARDKATWLTRVEKDLTHYPGSSNEVMVNNLYSLARFDSKLAESHFETMKKASEVLKSSQLFTEVGVVVSKEANPAGAWGKIKKLADGLIEKSDDLNLTTDMAVTKVLESERGQQLYKEYLAEHSEQD